MIKGVRFRTLFYVIFFQVSYVQSVSLLA